MKKTIIGLVLCLATTWAACNSDNKTTTGPSPTPSAAFEPLTPTGGSTAAAPTASPDPTPDQTEGTPAKSRYEARILNSSGSWGVTIDHLGGWTGERVGVACYENPDRTTGENQSWHDEQVVSINSKGSETVSAKIPQCVPWQCDAFEGEAIRGQNIDVRYGRRLILGRSGGPQGNCTPPPPECEGEGCDPPPECDIEQLSSEAKQACQYGFELNTAACTFECNPPPECDIEELQANANATAANSCTFGVESVTLDTKACTFEFDCKPEPPCEPVGEPECPEQTWDTNSCSWVGECKPPECENTAELRNEVAKGRARCEAAGGEFEFEFFDYPVCEVELECELPPPEECELPEEGFVGLLRTGSADVECAQLGDYSGAGKDESFPWDLSGDFYLVKCGFQYELSYSLPGEKCETITNHQGRPKDVSHVSACVCEGVD